MEYQCDSCKEKTNIDRELNKIKEEIDEGKSMLGTSEFRWNVQVSLNRARDRINNLLNKLIEKEKQTTKEEGMK